MHQQLENFKNSLPTRRDETWKYTSLDFFFDDFDLNSAEYDLKLSFLNGTSTDGYISLSTEKHDRLELGHGNIAKDKAYLLSTELSSEKKVITIERDLPSPLVITHNYRGSKSFHSIVEIKSKVDESHILEVFQNEGNEKALCTNISFCHLTPGQKVFHTTYQKLNKESLLLNNTLGFSVKASEYHNVNISVGSRLSRHNVHTELNEQEAFSSVHGLYLTKENTHIDTNSFIYHNAAHTNSEQLYKSVLDDTSRGVFTGLIRVEKDAQQINSDQLNKNLLLTNKAHANSRPQLEIYADDVKCAHGSTTGQISEEELFYLESRGINKEKARTMLAQAFINEVVFKIENAEVKNYILEEIENA